MNKVTKSYENASDTDCRIIRYNPWCSAPVPALLSLTVVPSPAASQLDKSGRVYQL